jgi:hypothetical protein
MMKVLSRVSIIAQTCQKQFSATLGGSGFGRSLSFCFSKTKKGKVELKAPSIHFKKLSE